MKIEISKVTVSIGALFAAASLVVAPPVCANDAAQSGAAPSALTEAQQKSLQEALRLMMRGQYARAIDAFRDLAKSDAARLTATVRMAQCLLESGQYHAATLELQEVAEQGQSDAMWRTVMAKVLLETGKYEEAMAHCRKAVDLDANALEARYLLGFLLETTGKKKEAIQTYRWFAENRPNIPATAEAQTILGRALDRYSLLISQPSRFANLILQEILQKAGEKLDKTDWRPRLAAGELLLAKYNTKQATEEFRAALRINPNCVGAHIGLALVALEDWKFSAAEKHLQDAFRANSNSPAVYHTLALVRMTERRFEDATKQLDKALGINPNHLDSLALMAAAYKVMWRLDKSQEFLKRFESINAQSGQAYYTIAEWLAAERQNLDAERHYKRAIEKSPELANPRLGLGLLYMQIGNRDKEAREQLEKAFAIDKFHQKAFNTLGLLDEMDKFERIETPHFTLRFDARHDAILRHELSDFLEGMYREVTGLFKFEPKNKTTIEIYPSHTRFAVRTTGLPWIGTVGACVGDVIALDSPDIGRGAAPFDWARVLTHEFAHTVTLAATENRIPHWMTEGLAVYAERAPKNWAWVRLLVHTVRANEILPVDRVTWSFWNPRRGIDRQLAYAQSEWMCQYIVEKWGWDKILEMLAAFRERQTQAQAFQNVLGVTEKEFDAQFAEWARKQIKAWGFTDEPIYELKEIERLLREQPENYALLANLAETQFLDIARHIRENPQDFQSAARIGRAFEPAALTARRCLERQPNNTLALSVLAAVLQRQGRDAEALKLWEQILKLDPKHPSAPRILGVAAVEARKWDDAIRYFKLLKQNSPLDPAAAENLAEIYIQTGKPELALPELIELDKTNVHEVALRLKISRLYKQLGKLDEAITAARRALQIHPFDITARQELATLYAQNKDYDNAIRHLKINCEAQPRASEHHARLAMVYKAAGKMEQAKAAARVAVRLDPKSPAKELLEEE
jgi:tetratricopeptide (TPR) repeat protein